MRFLNGLFNVFVLSFLYFDLLLQGDRFRFQLFLLRFIGLAQHIIAFIRQPPAGVVLINLDEQSFQLGNTAFVAFQALSADADLLTAFHAELFLHDRAEIILVSQDIPHNRLNVLENQPLQYLDANEMPITLFFAFAVQRAVKKVLIEIAVVG